MVLLRPALVPLALALATASCGSDSGKSSTNSGAGNQTPTDEAPTFVGDEGSVTLQAGQEGLLCNQMAVPSEYATGDWFVTGIDADVSLGTHHLVVMGNDDPVGTPAPLCKDTGGQPTTGGALFQDLSLDGNLATPVIDSLKRVAFAGGGGAAKIRFPAGYGKAMPLGYFESSHHVLNVGQDPLEIHGRFGIHAVTKDEIQFPLGALFANAMQVSVPPRSDGSVEGTMTVSEAIDVVVLTSHSHNFTTKFEMFVYRNGSTESEPVYSTESYESPAVTVLDPPLHLEPGDGITFRCSYHNGMDKTLAWGVTGGEMCMPLGMYAHPRGGKTGVPPTISVLVNDARPALLVEGTSGFFG